MKKILSVLLILVMLLTLAGCSQDAEESVQSAPETAETGAVPSEEPQASQAAPTPDPDVLETVEHDYVSPIGWYYCLDQANAEFLDIEKDWVVVFMGHNDAEGYDEYGLFDNMYVNESNLQEMIANGYLPVVSYRVWYEEVEPSRKVAKMNIRIPDKNINDVDEYPAEKIQKYQYLLLQYLFDQLTEDQVNAIIRTLNLTTEEQFAAYRSGADASGFQGGQVEIYPDNTDSTPFVIRSAYDSEYNTIVLTIQ